MIRKILLFILLCFTAFIVLSQRLEYKAEYYAMSFKNKDSKWSPWTSPASVTGDIYVDYDVFEIKIVDRLFYMKNIEDSVGITVISCEDDKGQMCNVWFDKKSILVFYDKFAVGYGL